MKLKQSLSPIALVLTLSSSLLLVGCDDGPQSANQSDSPTVNVKVFQTEPLSYTVKMNLPARVIASQVAEIRPQVNGIILKREFEESSNVTAGQSLYQIDPALYQASYDSAVANVASAEASANIAHLTLKRYEGLLKTKSISQQDYDKAAAEAKTADANVLVAKAALNGAKVNLDYTKVYSPIDGYIGKSSVTEGALVAANQPTPLALVQQLDPIYIDMTLAATKFKQFEQDKNASLINTDNEKVELYFSDNTRYELDGDIKFSDKTVSESTGTVTLRSEFENPDVKVLPGMFVKAKVTFGTINDVALVPQKGITSNEAGNYTAIVAIPLGSNDEKGNPKYYFEKRNDVKVYGGISGYWVVLEGINPGEKVVTTGLLNLATMNLNDPNKKVMANIIEQPQTLSQKDLNHLIENSLK